MSPLNKRLPREFTGNIGKWLGIVLLLVMTISLVAGFLMASSSISRILSTAEEDYQIEDGRFTSYFKVSDEVIDEIEDLDVTVYENFSYDVPIVIDGSDADMNVRVYSNREEIDLPAYFEGSAPSESNEIALDRVFCANNDLSVGETVLINDTPFVISGIMSLSDYQAMFEKNTDFVFNAQTFSVAQVSDSGFSQLKSASCSYTYSFLADDQSLSDAQRTDLEEDILDVLEDNNVSLYDFMDKDANNGIGYAQDDLEGDSLMWKVLMYMMVVILAFVFVVLTSATIDEESAVIGTLLASGYRKSELLRHYLALPLISGIVGAVLGNVLGYLFFIEQMSGLYYNSYSLPPYETTWDWGVFAQSTLLPLAILIVVSLVGLFWKLLRCTPLQFLRYETNKRSRKGGRKLPESLSFASRFRLRVFGRNISHFATLFVGILFASLLLLFGFCMLPTVDRYASSLADSLVSEHTYTLKAPVELEGTEEQQEMYAAALKLSDNVDMSAIDEDELEDKLTSIMEDRIEDDIESQVQSMLTGGSTSTYIDLSRYGMGVVDMTTFDEDDIDSNDIDFEAFDFSDISQEDLGLEDVDLGDLSLNDFFSLMQKASDIDEDANVINTQENSQEAIDQAEKFVAANLEYDRGGDAGWESVTLYGIQEDSRYYDEFDLSEDAIVAGNGLAQKFDLEVGDVIQLYDKYEDKTYEFTIGSIWGSDCAMNVFLPFDTVNSLMENDDDFFSGYLSDQDLNIDQLYLVNDLTPDQMSKIGAQMEDSMGDMMSLLVWISVAIFIVLMYLLTKTIIERSARSISCMKVFGYTNAEINKLYLRSMAEAVVISLLVAIPIVVESLALLVKVIFMRYSGNFIIALPWDRLALEFILGVACFAVVAFLHNRRISRVPLALALKIQE